MWTRQPRIRWPCEWGDCEQGVHGLTVSKECMVSLAFAQMSLWWNQMMKRIWETAENQVSYSPYYHLCVWVYVRSRMCVCVSMLMSVCGWVGVSVVITVPMCWVWVCVCWVWVWMCIGVGWRWVYICATCRLCLNCTRSKAVDGNICKICLSVCLSVCL